ncbi:PPE family protein, SVP subgroup [Mycobacterium paraterrae]|uniref:PPE domain-containing protein n=1 Tax=Mycobacterium paraterrae TaxID=577492 RepID=A0ABY3VP65_9MYCO|nr:PPE domain-containing protein [Mycobacterium paraterrae]UMB71236.1 PPE domain-containing protein [Mycobacterium paraterrae]
MDFVSCPPEINSARMYTGAGSEPLLAAARAWGALADELHSAADSYQAVTTELTTGSWLGAASASMSAASSSYAAWLRVTAARAEHSCLQAKSAAAAYQTALSATVPPPMVAANRSELLTLVATNLLGENSQAIAATEAEYAEMWAQDLEAMYGYAASSASSTVLPPFDPPPQTTNPTGLVEQAAGELSGAVEGTAQQAFSAASSALPSAGEAELLALVADFFTVVLAVPAFYSLFVAVPANVVGIIGFPVALVGTGVGLHTDEIVSGWNGEEPYPSTDPAPVEPFPAPLLNLPAGTVPARSIEAGVSEARVIGGLSVPPTWAAGTPEVRPVAYTLPGTVAAAAVPAAEVGFGGTLGEMALAGMAGRIMADAVGAGAGKAAQGARAALGVRPTTGDDETASQEGHRAVVTGVAAELREFAKLVDEGLLTNDEYLRQKKRLLGL